MTRTEWDQMCEQMQDNVQWRNVYEILGRPPMIGGMAGLKGILNPNDFLVEQAIPSSRYLRITGGQLNTVRDFFFHMIDRWAGYHKRSPDSYHADWYIHKLDEEWVDIAVIAHVHREYRVSYEKPENSGIFGYKPMEIELEGALKELENPIP